MPEPLPQAQASVTSDSLTTGSCCAVVKLLAGNYLPEGLLAGSCSVIKQPQPLLVVGGLLRYYHLKFPLMV